MDLQVQFFAAAVNARRVRVLRAIVQCRFSVTEESQFTKHLEGENEPGELLKAPTPRFSTFKMELIPTLLI